MEALPLINRPATGQAREALTLLRRSSIKVASSGLRKARFSPLGERGSMTVMLLDGVDGGFILMDMGCCGSMLMIPWVVGEK